LRFHCSNVEETRAAARALGAVVRDEPARGLILALAGPLGAGKTHFVKGLAEGLGIDPDAVTSPTFVIMNQYAASWGSLGHVDLYRLARAEELDDAGFLDLLVPGAVVAIEWFDRFPHALPSDRLEVRLARPPGDEGSRSFAVSAKGVSSQSHMERWLRRLAGAALAHD
jgi:tRNA threonylcarbamoyladenosine biosynthesis protein TsaE